MHKRISLYVLCGYIFILPLAVLPFFVNYYDYTKLFLSLLLLLFIFLHLTVMLIKAKGMTVKLIHPFLVFLGIAVLISLTLSPDLHLSLWGTPQRYTWGIIHWVLFLLLAGAAAQYAGESARKKVNLSIAGSGLLVSFFGILEYGLHAGGIISDYRISSSIGEPNRLAFFLLACLPIVWYSRNRSTIHFERGLYYISFVAICTALILTGSRSSYFTGSILLILFILTNRPWYLLKNKSVWVTAGLIFVLFIFKALPYIVSTIRYESPNKSSPHIRFSEMETSFRIVGNRIRTDPVRFIFGSGPETTGLVLMQEKSNVLGSGWALIHNGFTFVRNHYLHLLLNTGFTSFIGYLALMITALTIRKYPEYRGAVIVVLIHGFFYYIPFPVSIILSISLGLLLAKPIRQVRLQLPLRAAAGIFMFFIVCPYLVFILWKDIAASRLRMNGLDVPDKVEKLLNIDPDNYENQRIALNWYMGYGDVLPDGRERIELLSRRLMAASWRHSLNAQAAVDGYYYLLVNSKDIRFGPPAIEAAETYVSAVPSHPLAYDKYGLVLLELVRLEESLLYFDRAISLDPGVLGPYLHKGEALKQLGRWDEALSYYDTVRRERPEWGFAASEYQRAVEQRDEAAQTDRE